MEPITMIPGAISACVGLTGFYMNHLRGIDAWAKARDSLQKISGTHANRHATQSSKELLKWLSYGDIIVPHVKQQLVIRLFSALVGIAVLAGAVSIDATGQLLNQSATFEGFDVLLCLLQLALGMFAGSKWFLRKEEADFLSRLAALHKNFYDLFVQPAIKEFNYNMDDSIDFQAALDNLRKQTQESVTYVRVVMKSPPK